MKEKLKDLALGAVIAVWAAMAPIHTILCVVFGLVLADMVTGIWKSIRVKGEKFSSARLRDTPVKLVPYLIVILAGFGLDKIVAIDGLFFARAFALLIGGTEATSIGENVRDLTGLDIGAVIRDKLKPKPPAPPQV
jgi:hypothetical protein